MDTQNRDQQKSSSREKFPEPRGWALEWHTLHFDQVSTREEARSTTEQEQKNSNGEKFPKPRSWAVKWDGLVLSEAGERQNGRAWFPVNTTPE
jgi:hypothetical protein